MIAKKVESQEKKKSQILSIVKTVTIQLTEFNFEGTLINLDLGVDIF